MQTSSDIDGWFGFEDVYRFLLSTINGHGTFVECGAWLGKSSSFLCDIASPLVSIYIVDHWRGSISEQDSTHKIAKNTDIYAQFLANMGSRKFTPIRKPATEAAKIFKDSSCDVVFIDMDHSYDSVKQDIATWLPKVKKNGYIAGHDYCPYWHGVIGAVNEKFGEDKIKVMQGCWIYKNE